MTLPPPCIAFVGVLGVVDTDQVDGPLGGVRVSELELLSGGGDHSEE